MSKQKPTNSDIATMAVLVAATTTLVAATTVNFVEKVQADITPQQSK